MNVSTPVLARKIKEMMLAQPAMRAMHGTTDVVDTFRPNIKGDLNEKATEIRSSIGRIVSNLVSSMPEGFLANMPVWEDECKEGAKERNMLFAIRSIYSLANSTHSFTRTTWQIRTMEHDDMPDCFNTNSDFDFKNVLGEASGLFQFRRHKTDDENPWLFSFQLSVDGITIARGTRVPLYKAITGLMKHVIGEGASLHAVQEIIADLAKLKAADDSMYWYVTNQEIAMHYLTFSKATSSTSCMAHPHSFYRETGNRQHPMDVYNNSKDWSLMLTSEKSPEEIIRMCDIVMANPDQADMNWTYPFMTRTMVMVAARERYAENHTTPYVFGKTYGHDKLVHYFTRGDSIKGCYNQNPILTQMDEINGGRVLAIKSTAEGMENAYVLPYFDRANLATLIVEDGVEYWESVGEFEESRRTPIARSSYETGTARFVGAYSPAKGKSVSFSDTTVMERFPTMFGDELVQYKSHYEQVNINGKEVNVPSRLLINVEGERVLQGSAIRLYDGSLVLRSSLENTERFETVEGFGIFDKTNPDHASVLATLTA